MDYLNEATLAAAAPAASNNILECIIGVVVALAVLRMEVMRHSPDLQWSCSCSWVRKAWQQHTPEDVGVAACVVLSVALRLKGGQSPEIDEKTWAAIMREWPLLLTADSLLALQSMLRLVVFVSAALRCARAQPLSQEAALFFFSAAVARAALAARSDVYRLDGPLGGILPIVCEVLAVPLLGSLCRDIRPKTLVASMVTMAVAARIASRNRLALAEDPVTDGLFMFAHIAELLAAFAYLFRALLLGVSRAGVAVRFGHAILPMQQVLAAYYFVQAFENVPALVAAGRPFEILQFAGVAQLGAYVAAAVLYLAENLETTTEDEEDEAEEEEQEEQELRPNPFAVHSDAATAMTWGNDVMMAVRAAI